MSFCNNKFFSFKYIFLIHCDLFDQFTSKTQKSYLLHTLSDSMLHDYFLLKLETKYNLCKESIYCHFKK